MNPKRDHGSPRGPFGDPAQRLAAARANMKADEERRQELAKKLIAGRQAKGLSIKDVSRLILVTEKRILGIEAGIMETSRTIQVRLFRLYGID